VRAGIALRETTEARLAANSLLRIEGDRREVIILCHSGSCWITQEGDLEDHFIDSGECFAIDERGLVIVQALQETKIFLTHGARVCARNPHLKQARQPIWWRASGYIAATLPLLFIVTFWWMASDFKEQDPADWKPVLALAEASREKGDLYQAKALYAQAGRIASWQEDWEALLAVACGMKKLDSVGGPSGTSYTLLLRAVLAAESKQSRAGIYAVAKAFTAIGEHYSASAALSRVKKGWPEAKEEVQENTFTDCWRTHSVAGRPAGR